MNTILQQTINSLSIKKESYIEEIDLYISKCNSALMNIELYDQVLFNLRQQVNDIDATINLLNSDHDNKICS